MTFLSMPTFWGPRAPDQVLAEGNYLRAAALAGAGSGRHATDVQAPDEQVDWLRDLQGIDYFDRLSHMITEWADLGMVLPIEG